MQKKMYKPGIIKICGFFLFCFAANGGRIDIKTLSKSTITGFGDLQKSNYRIIEVLTEEECKPTFWPTTYDCNSTYYIGDSCNENEVTRQSGVIYIFNFSDAASEITTIERNAVKLLVRYNDHSFQNIGRRALATTWLIDGEENDETCPTDERGIIRNIFNTCNDYLTCLSVVRNDHLRINALNEFAQKILLVKLVSKLRKKNIKLL